MEENEKIRKTIRQILASFQITETAFLEATHFRILQPHLMPENIQSAALWLMPYYTGAHPQRNVSLYSVSKDYHLFSRTIGNALVSALSEEYPGECFKAFCDSSPIDEVGAALLAGLGMIGKNRLLIHPVYGSYVFIGSLLMSIKLPGEQPKPVKTCLNCGLCGKACAFLRGECEVCFSELNQRKVLTDRELAAVKSRPIRWGCDVCQEVCPMNRNVPPTPISFFYEDILENVTAEMIDGMSKAVFRERAYAWRGKKTIRRNLE